MASTLQNQADEKDQSGKVSYLQPSLAAKINISSSHLFSGRTLTPNKWLSRCRTPKTSLHIIHSFVVQFPTSTWLFCPGFILSWLVAPCEYHLCIPCPSTSRKKMRITPHLEKGSSSSAQVAFAHCRVSKTFCTFLSAHRYQDQSFMMFGYEDIAVAAK